MSTVQTVDGLPVVDDGESNVDLTGLFEGETDRRPATGELAFTEEDDVIPPVPVPARLGYTVGAYALREPSAPRRRRTSVRRWLAPAKLLMAAGGLVIAGTLIVLLRHAVRTGL
jgi:hypothetical protein